MTSTISIAGAQAPLASLLRASQPQQMAARRSSAWTDFFVAGPVAVSQLQVDLHREPSVLGSSVLHLLKLSHDVRTSHTERLIYTELAIEWMGMLHACDLLNANIQEALSQIGSHLGNVVDEIRNLYLERGNLPALFTEDLVNHVFDKRYELSLEGKEETVRVPIIRLDVNITTANKIDPKGRIGNTLLESSLDWLRDHFGEENVYREPLGTSFLVVLKDGVDFKKASKILKDFEKGVGEKMGKKARRLNLRGFVPSHVALGLEFEVKGTPNIRDAGFNIRQIKKAQADMFNAVEAFRIRLAASTVYLSDKPPSTETKKSLYENEDLPSDNDLNFKRYLKRRAGYIGDGVFDVRNGTRSGQTVKEYPRARQIVGQLSHPANDNSPNGGALENFTSLVQGLSHFVGNETQLIDGFNIGIEGLKLFLDVGHKATRVSNYTRLLKPLEIFKNIHEKPENANFFAERVAAAGYTQFAVFEYDSYKDFRAAHAPKDNVDSDFQSIRKIWFDTAKEMGLSEPIITPLQGDLVMVAFNDTNKQGNHILQKYIDRVRQKVRMRYKDKPFQRSAKFTSYHIDDKGRRVPHTERLPIWVRKRRGKLEYSLGHESPGSDWKPYMGTLTISGTHFELSQPIRSVAMARYVMREGERSGDFIDETVKQLGEVTLIQGTIIPLKKDSWEELPPRPNFKNHFDKSSNRPNRTRSS